MKNKTTYEMVDIMGLIARELSEKGLVHDPGSIVIRAAVAGTEVFPSDIEIDVNVSWVGVVAPAGLSSVARLAVPVPDGRDTEDRPAIPRDLLDEAPEPGVGPAIEIGNVTSASQLLADSTAGPFSPARVKKRVTSLDGESLEYPGPSRTGGR